MKQNQIGPIGAKYLAEALKSNKKLDNLGLWVITELELSI